jgi:hypothetical protein
MKIQKGYLIGALLIIACLVAAALTKARAQSGGGYDLTWNTQESGGRVEASGGGYSLYGSLGQPDAGAALNGEGYSLAGGFWSGVSAYQICLPVVSK